MSERNDTIVAMCEYQGKIFVATDRTVFVIRSAETYDEQVRVVARLNEKTGMLELCKVK